MPTPEQLLQNNKTWANQREQKSPGFFDRLSGQQKPKYMWIGCSDSRVPANEIVGLDPGEIFVHRNIANQVHHTDLNCLSGVQYAVDVLKVEHIIVTGHYDCGGVEAAITSQHFGIVDNWIRGIRDNFHQHYDDLKDLSPQEMSDRMTELNVIKQVENLSHTRIIQSAWEKGRPLSIHGWVYRLGTGLIHNLQVSRHAAGDIAPVFRSVPRL
ncbi:carbonate dehydratase [Ghiorsea bivora]|uniref:carbonate dehydratase n=1 Tax=Ghiorsea bivora TaxID=1485545 RepID=UPI000571853B|nr:carbonate dehydratase [Ghiorsea bivora]